MYFENLKQTNKKRTNILEELSLTPKLPVSLHALVYIHFLISICILWDSIIYIITFYT